MDMPAPTKYPPVILTPEEIAMAASYDPKEAAYQLAEMRDKHLVQVGPQENPDL